MLEFCVFPFAVLLKVVFFDRRLLRWCVPSLDELLSCSALLRSYPSFQQFVHDEAIALLCDESRLSALSSGPARVVCSGAGCCVCDEAICECCRAFCTGCVCVLLRSFRLPLLPMLVLVIPLPAPVIELPLLAPDRVWSVAPPALLLLAATVEPPRFSLCPRVLRLLRMSM